MACTECANTNGRVSPRPRTASTRSVGGSGKPAVFTPPMVSTDGAAVRGSTSAGVTVTAHLGAWCVAVTPVLAYATARAVAALGGRVARWNDCEGGRRRGVREGHGGEAEGVGGVGSGQHALCGRAASARRASVRLYAWCACTVT